MAMDRDKKIKTMKNRLLLFLINYKIIAVALFYMICSSIFGETHPFSCFPMYSSFPNWSYTFYLADENGKLIPSEEFDTTGGKMGHTFYSICESKKTNYGNGIESKTELQNIGKEMMDLILLNNKNNSKKHPYLAIHRIFFFYKNDTIQKINTIIYEKNLE